MKYLGTEPHEAEVAGLRVDVYAVPGAKADTLDTQAIILANVLGLSAEELAQLAYLAIEDAAAGTPCSIARGSLRGSSTVWTARLACK